MRKHLLMLVVLGGLVGPAAAQQPSPVSPYRAGFVPPPATMASSQPNLQKSILSPYLNLVRDQNDNDLVNLGINYYLGTRTEIARRTNERILAGELSRQSAQQAQAAGTTGHRTYFDSSYGRPAQQLYGRGGSLYRR